jgi:hypothetical protein
MDYVVSKETAEIIMAVVRSFIWSLSGYGAVAIARDIGTWLADRDIEREAKKQHGSR